MCQCQSGARKHGPASPSSIKQGRPEGLKAKIFAEPPNPVGTSSYQDEQQR